MYDELVKRLRSVTDGSHEDKCDGCPYDEDYPCCADCLDTMFKQAADAIEELYLTAESYKRSMEKWADEAAAWADKAENAKPQWIPVTERLPDEFQPVWVACKMEGRENWVFDTVYDPYLKCPWGQYYYLEKGEAVAYAWMDRSAPEPPKEETSNV